MAACVKVMRATLFGLLLSGAVRGFILDQQSSENCVDSTNLDCTVINRTSNLCANTDLARQLCPSFCGLCSIVDGNWTDWSAWSQCDVTCDNGTQYHTRTCTNPPPSPTHGVLPAGRPCVGPSSDTQICINDLCPVHGAWGSWSVWGECSVTCDVGMRRRDRHCDNPYPARNGDHCFGEGAVYRICLPGACADGGWSIWGDWSNCNMDCGGGLRYRNRRCDNPAPSPVGRGCEGNNQEVDMCTTCSVTPNIVFKARGVTDKSPTSHQRMVFSRVLVNAGGGYSASTGYFTAPMHGVYMFTVQMGARSNIYCEMHIVANGAIVGTISFQSNLSGVSTSGDGVAILSPGDLVYIRSYQSSPSTDCIYEDNDDWSTFSGVLLNAGV